MDKLYLVIPAYNEKDNIRDVVEEWHDELEKHNDIDYMIVVINDGSTDNTLTILEEMVSSINKLVVLNKKNGGHGSAVLYGYRYAIEQNAEWIFQNDGDGQTVTNEFGDFWRCRDKHDAIIGKRPTRGDGKSRKAVEDVLCKLIRIIFGVKLHDVNAPFRLMKTELVKKYIEKIPYEYNLPNAMLTTLFVYNDENVAFKNITFNGRKNGVNSINLKNITKIGIKAIFEFISIRSKL